ncbi:MAG TPA: hypothetical protein VN794_17315, partial [Methylomirabilota bacterium]|nr:hypothetical protein [Methylomirabilota bacterium]
ETQSVDAGPQPLGRRMGTRDRHEKQPIDSGRGAVSRSPVSSRQRLVLSLALFALVTAVFSPALRNGFVSYDDGTYVTANAHVRAGLTLDGITWAFRSTQGSNWHPLTWISHMLDCQVYGLRPWGHHLTNILLHAFNSALVFLLLTQLTGAVVRSFFVAALFGLHPAHVESVAWIAERKDVLSTCFFLLTLMAYGARRQRAEGRSQRAEGRSQRSGDRSQRSGDRSQRSAIRDRKSGF